MSGDKESAKPAELTRLERKCSHSGLRFDLRFDRLDVKHFICTPKAVAFVQATRGFSGVQRDDANLAAASLGQREFDEVAGEFFAAVLRLDVNVEQIAAVPGVRVEGGAAPSREA